MTPRGTSRRGLGPVVRQGILRGNGFRAYARENPAGFGGAPRRALRLGVIRCTAPCAPYAAHDSRGGDEQAAEPITQKTRRRRERRATREEQESVPLRPHSSKWKSFRRTPHRDRCIPALFVSVRPVHRRPSDRRVAGWTRALKTYPHDVAAPSVQREDRRHEQTVFQRGVG